MSWNTPIPKVIRSVSDSFLERSALNVNWLLKSAPFLERNLVIIVLDKSLGFFCQIKTNKQHIDPVRCEQLNYSRFHGFWQSFVTIGSCNHLMRIIPTYVTSATQRKVRSREDENYSNWAIINYGVYKGLYHISCLLQ